MEGGQEESQVGAVEMMREGEGRKRRLVNFYVVTGKLYILKVQITQTLNLYQGYSSIYDFVHYFFHGVWFGILF